MRPLRLELSGFTAFRDATVVDFADADYFAFVGPTGSGKSSLIDALIFALYGSIPRLDMRSVAPIISQGTNEARVRFDFAIGERAYTAVRVVRRQGDGASTKEARLECGDEVIAGDADSLTSEIERLLGLGFEEFTRCVVLPQGEFARFMHDKPAARGDLLVKLLDLAIYGRLQQRANLRAATAEAGAHADRRRLEDLSFATDESLTAARAQIGTLAELKARIDEDEPRIEALRETMRAAREGVKADERAVGLLERISMPPGVAELSEAVGVAATLVQRTDEQVAETEVASSTRKSGPGARAPCCSSCSTS